MATIFLDTEFTGLKQDAQLISLALLTGDGNRHFYAEFTDYDASLLTEWHLTHVIPYLRLNEQTTIPQLGASSVEIAGDRSTITQVLTTWLKQFTTMEVWADCPVYDWVLFCELFGGALQLPKQIFYLPFDLVTLFKAKGIAPDIDRRAFAGLEELRAGPQHNALVDAKVTKACYEKLMNP